MSEQHRRSISLFTRRQRSIFIAELKRHGHLKFVNHEYTGANEVTTNYQYLLCLDVINTRQISNHFRKDKQHLKITSEVIGSMSADGEVDALVLME